MRTGWILTYWILDHWLVGMKPLSERDENFVETITVTVFSSSA